MNRIRELRELRGWKQEELGQKLNVGKGAQGSDTDKLALIGHTSTDQLRDYQDVAVEDLRRIIDQI